MCGGEGLKSKEPTYQAQAIQRVWRQKCVKTNGGGGQTQRPQFAKVRTILLSSISIKGSLTDRTARSAAKGGTREEYQVLCSFVRDRESWISKFKTPIRLLLLQILQEGSKPGRPNHLPAPPYLLEDWGNFAELPGRAENQARAVPCARVCARVCKAQRRAFPQRGRPWDAAARPRHPVAR